MPPRPRVTPLKLWLSLTVTFTDTTRALQEKLKPCQPWQLSGSLSRTLSFSATAIRPYSIYFRVLRPRRSSLQRLGKRIHMATAVLGVLITIHICTARRVLITGKPFLGTSKPLCRTFTRMKSTLRDSMTITRIIRTHSHSLQKPSWPSGNRALHYLPEFMKLLFTLHALLAECRVTATTCGREAGREFCRGSIQPPSIRILTI